MPGPSADDHGSATKPADRWSLAVSSLLILGLVLATTAMVQAWRTSPQTPKPAPPPTKLKAEAPDPMSQAMAIRLPPPPAPKAVAPVSPSAPPPPQTLSKPRDAKPPTVKPRTIVPLKPPEKIARPKPKPRLVAAVRVTPLKPAQAPPIARPVRAPKAVTAQKPAPKQSVIDATQHRKTGGALLRLLEHGKGPSVEIAWPRSEADRQRLFRILTRCYGMRPALLTKGSRLFNQANAPGQPWAINRDRYSGFIRSPQGEPIREENRQFAAIASRHGLTDWRPVRVFPRAVDSVLLGGLESLLGERYQSASQIRAVYQLRRAGLSLTGFQIDGKAIAGMVSLRLSLSRGCD